MSALGTERPFRYRLRFSAELRQRSDRVGRPREDEIRLSEQRLDLGAAFAPHERLFLLVTLPLLRREVRYVNESLERTTGIGDVELRAKFFLFDSGGFGARHLVAVTAGLKLPTAQLARDEDGVLLAMELQPGSGSFDPIVGVSYAFSTFPWSLYASLSGQLATAGPDGARASSSLRGALFGQRQIVDWFALRAGFDLRADRAAQEAFAPEPDSGGLIGFASGDLLFSPWMDWLLYATVRVPILNRLSGRHDEGPIFAAGFALDL